MGEGIEGSMQSASETAARASAVPTDCKWALYESTTYRTADSSCSGEHALIRPLQVIFNRSFHPESSAPPHSNEEDRSIITDLSPSFGILRHHSWEQVFKLSDCRVHARRPLCSLSYLGRSRARSSEWCEMQVDLHKAEVCG
jgi:hypothetical protein